MKRVMVFALTLVCVATQLAVPVSAFAADDNASDVPATVVGDNRRFTGVDFTEPSAEQWELFRVDNLDDKTLYIDVTKKVGDGEAKHLVRRSPYVPDPQADKDFGGKGVAHIVTLAMAGEDGKPLAPQDVFDNEADRAEYGIAVYAAQRGGQPLYEATIYPVYAVRTDADGARVDTPKLVGIRTASADEVGRAKNMGMGDSYYATAEDGSQETYALEKVGNVDNAFDAQAGAYYLTYKKTAAGSVEGVVNYVDEEGNIVAHDAVPGLTNDPKETVLRTQFFAEAKSGPNKDKVCYFRALTGPNQKTYLTATRSTHVVRVVEVSCEDANAYPVLVRYEDTNGDLIWSDEVDVTGKGQQYTLPTVFSTKQKEGVNQFTLTKVVGANTELDSEKTRAAAKEWWTDEEDTEPILNFTWENGADEFGVDEKGRRVVTAQYKNQDVDKRVTFTVVEVDGEAGTEMGRKTYTVTPDNDAVYTPEAREVNGTKYLPWTGNTEPLTYAWNDISNGTDLLQYVYYVPEGYVPSGAYDVTVRYQDIATGNLLRTETVTVDPEIVDYVNILGEERFTQDGEEYVRLDGQETPVRHAYFSNARTYTVYYRNVNDVLNARVVINRTQIITTNRPATLPDTGGTAAGPAAAGTAPVAGAAATPVAAGITAGTPADAGVTPGAGTVVVNDDGNPLANLEGQDTASERVEDDANPLARGGAMTTGLIAGSLAALVALGLLAFWFFKRKKKADETSDPQNV